MRIVYIQYKQTCVFFLNIFSFQSCVYRMQAGCIVVLLIRCYFIHKRIFKNVSSCKEVSFSPHHIPVLIYSPLPKPGVSTMQTSAWVIGAPHSQGSCPRLYNNVIYRAGNFLMNILWTVELLAYETGFPSKPYRTASRANWKKRISGKKGGKENVIFTD